MSIKLGSLFDGSGGFPLAGAINGIEPVWAAEVEPYPIAVTRSRFPQMEHLGSVTEVHGDKVRPVDVITFGSPCQDLSVAGKRAGIHDGQRSNLFFEAIRIIKEMRDATNGRHPTFAVWENVPGAFSSNKGADFRCVLEAFVRISAEISVPGPANGRWNPAGEIVGDGFSIAWRQLDAQYWGVPQRCKRIYLVADFRGGRAGEILFERESMRGNPAACGAPEKDAAANAAGSAGRSREIECLNPWDHQSKRIFGTDGHFPTLTANCSGGQNNQAVLHALDSMSSNSMKSSNPHSGFHAETVAKTLQAGGVDPTCNQGGNVIVEPIYTLQGNGIDRAETAGCNGRGWREDVCYTLNTIDRPAICFKAGQGAKAHSLGESETVTPTLGSEAGGNSVPGICYPQVARTLTAEADASPCIDRGKNVVSYERPIIAMEGSNKGRGQVANGLIPCLKACHPSEIVYAENRLRNSAQDEERPPRKYIIRRLTPLECCRLQGFPDGWGIPDHKDRLSNEELEFWQGVRDTCASIAGKPPKKYSAKSLTRWYNALHTDSAEYKMWGNGIALPCAAFVLGNVAKHFPA